MGRDEVSASKGERMNVPVALARSSSVMDHPSGGSAEQQSWAQIACHGCCMISSTYQGELGEQTGGCLTVDGLLQEQLSRASTMFGRGQERAKWKDWLT